MATYELSFEVAAITDEAEDLLAEQLDAMVSSHSGVITVTLLHPGETCLQAALAAVDRMRALDVEVLRLVDDVVSRSEIARRIQVTPQAVGQWIRGERQTGLSFPKPYIIGATELWLWGEVVNVLRDHGHGLDADISFPNRRDIQLIGGALAERAVSVGLGWTARDSTFPGLSAISFRSPKGQVMVNTLWTDFALAG